MSKLHSGTFKTKAGALFCKSHCATCSPVYVILCYVAGSYKGPIVVTEIAGDTSERAAPPEAKATLDEEAWEIIEG